MSERTRERILRFKKDQVQKLIDHARSSKEHRPNFEQLIDPACRKDGKEPPEGHWPSSDEADQSKIPAGLHLAADHGVYLMSNGLPSETVSNARGHETSRVVYAEGINPDVDEDWWDKKRAATGGDDCVLFFDLDSIEEGMKAPGRILEIGLRNNGMYVIETFICLG